MEPSSAPTRDGPLTFHNLPLELKLEVIELLYDSNGTTVLPIMAPDAAWVNPYRRLGVTKESHLPMLEDTEEDTLVTPPIDIEQLPLKSLRLVSKEYYAICTPFLYRELDLEGGVHQLGRLKKVLKNIAKPYGRHVRYIRIHVAGKVGGAAWNSVMHTMAGIVAECRLATAIAIYYENGTEPPFGPLATEVVRMVETTQVTQIGIYSMTILRAERSSRKWALGASSSPIHMLKALLSSPQACRALRRLDLVLEDLDVECFELLRRNSLSLQSLTVRKAFRSDRLSAIWNAGETYWWAQSANLTSLVLIECQRPGAKHMVGLVACFPALRHLVWASSGTSREPTPPLPEAGWSHDLKARFGRPNLKVLHIEHALEWELCWMGLISAETVKVLHFNEARLANALDRGVEMFLGMKKLQVLPPWNLDWIDADIRDRVSLSKPNGRTLDAICEERGVLFSRDDTMLNVYGQRSICCRKCLTELILS